MAQTEAELLDNPVAGRPTLILRSPDFHSITEVVAERPRFRNTFGRTSLNISSHFEMGRAMAERLGYAPADLD